MGGAPWGPSPDTMSALALFGIALTPLAFNFTQPRVDDRRLDEVDLAAGTRQPLTRAQPVHTAGQVTHRDARLGLGTQRAQVLAELLPLAPQGAPGGGIGGMQRGPGLQFVGAAFETGRVLRQ